MYFWRSHIRIRLDTNLVLRRYPYSFIPFLLFGRKVEVQCLSFIFGTYYYSWNAYPVLNMFFVSWKLFSSCFKWYLDHPMSFFCKGYTGHSHSLSHCHLSLLWPVGKKVKMAEGQKGKHGLQLQKVFYLYCIARVFGIHTCFYILSYVRFDALGRSH